MKALIKQVAVKLDGPTLVTFTTEDKESARSVWDSFKDVDVEITIAKYRKKRSLASNRLFWVLVDKIAFVLAIPSDEIYRQIIMEGGFKTYTDSVPNDDVNMRTYAWEDGHLGRQAIPIGDSREKPGETDVMFYYGSSDYDNAEFARLLQSVVDECDSLEIPHEKPDFKALLEGKK